jgi:hypothetical protein
MGMHIDHGCFLDGSSGSVTPPRPGAKYDNRQDRSIAPADHVASRRADQNTVGRIEVQAFRLGQASSGEGEVGKMTGRVTPHVCGSLASACSASSTVLDLIEILPPEAIKSAWVGKGRPRSRLQSFPLRRFRPFAQPSSNR